ncbi:MAG: ATP-binding protein [Spirulina sp. SIO3F2]|nr:ATP-binding protein [Spirulina sp. SIO3F2]
MKEMPRLDLAPKLKRPLSLWNPLDYLRLLYWVFYFPQALRWYVDEFGGGYIPQSEMTVRKGLRNPRESAIQRALLVQGMTISLILFYWNLEQLGLATDWFFLASGVLFLTFVLASLGVTLGVASSIALGMALRVSFVLGSFIGNVADVVGKLVRNVVAGEVGHFLASGVSNGLILGLMSGLVFGLVRGVMLDVMGSSVGAVALDVVGGLGGVLALGVVGSSVGILALGLMGNSGGGGIFGFVMGVVAVVIAFGVAVVMAFNLAFNLALWRPDSWLMGTSLNLRTIQNSSFLFSRVAVIPLPFLKKELKKSLRSNWEEGLHDSNELLRYSHQFIPVVDSINQVISNTSGEQLIWKTARLAHQPFDWKLVEFASISLRQKMQATFKRNLLFWKTYKEIDYKITESLRLDTLPRATAAGFWYLHEKDPTHATEAFTVVRHILYGEEMYILATNLDQCTQAKTFKQIHITTVQPCPEPDPSKRLRQTSWPALEAFGRITQDAQLIHQSRSKATKAQALARAQGELKTILDTQDQLPQAEGGLIIDIATTWRDALLSIASEIGNIEILEPVVNPYTIGDPVEGSRFVGREDLLRELESLWLNAENPPSVLVYGHRRMGKTSILRNLTGGSDLKLIYVNLQLLGSVTQGLSEVLLTIADDIAQHLEIPAPPDDAFLNFPQRTFERYLRDILTQLNCRALIIALDEFEIIEDLIQKGQLQPDFMGYLRGLIQMDKRLAFALAGLHTLEEMTRDYFEPFFGSTYGIPVSFLSEAASRQILENPSDDFPLEYEPNAIDEIYRLTHGQPYLVQLIGFQLVRRFNEQVFETGREREPRLTVADVKAVTDISQADLFRNGRYYFEGVWNQAAQGASDQQAILLTLAPHPEGLTLAELQIQLPDPGNLTTALDTLKRHDAVDYQPDRYSIRVELFRLWCCKRAED